MKFCCPLFFAAIIIVMATAAQAQSYYNATIGEFEKILMCTNSITPGNNICIKTSRGKFVFRCNTDNSVSVYKCATLMNNGQCSSCSFQTAFHVGQTRKAYFDYRNYNLTRIFSSVITTGVKKMSWAYLSNSNCSSDPFNPRYVDWYPSALDTCLPNPAVTSIWNLSSRYHCSSGTAVHHSHSSKTCSNSPATNAYLSAVCDSFGSSKWECVALSSTTTAKAFGLVASAGKICCCFVLPVVVIVISSLLMI